MNAAAKAPDLFALSHASVQTLIEDLKREETLDDRGGAAPPRAEQIAGLVLAESIRLIRMGTRPEIARASNELSQLLIGSAGERLESEQPEAHRLLSGASVALGAATPASSKGGAQTVLRSWNGDAGEVVKMLLEAPSERLPRARLREAAGIEDESHFSHLLSNLEAAGLIVRVRTGKTILVRLAAAGRTEEVRRELGVEERPILLERTVTEALEQWRSVDFIHPRLPPSIEPAGLAPPAPNEVFAVGETIQALTFCQLTSMSSLDPEADEAFGGALSTGENSPLASRSRAN